MFLLNSQLLDDINILIASVIHSVGGNFETLSSDKYSTLFNGSKSFSGIVNFDQLFS